MITQQKGFTLIEVLMVVVIIGAMASMAMAQYQDFVGRAQVSDAVVLLTSSRVDVEEHIVEKGTFPQDQDFANMGTLRSGHYTENIEVVIADTCSVAGVIQATMRPSNVSSGIAGKTFVVERDVVGNWRCTRGWNNPLADSYLPHSCRQDAGVPADPPDCPRFKVNHGHGNNIDGVDASNPGKANKDDPSGTIDDEAT